MIWYRTKHFVIHFLQLWYKSILQLFSRDGCCQSLMVIYVVSPLSWFYGSQHNYCPFMRNPRTALGLHEGCLIPALSYGWPWGELTLVIYGKHHLGRPICKIHCHLVLNDHSWVQRQSELLTEQSHKKYCLPTQVSFPIIWSRN